MSDSEINIFADLHHGDLYFSLHCMLEKRMKFNLYRPIGFDWFDNGYWQIAKPYNHARDTVGQYLNIGDSKWDQFKNLNGNYQETDGVYHIWEPVHGYHQKAITFEKFKSMKFDVIMPTVDLHDHCYEDLRNKFQPKAKIIAHLGNTGQVTHLPNVMHSVPYKARPGQNTVLVHQELDSDLYKFQLPNPNTRNIYSMVNCYPYPHIYNKYKSLMTDVNWKYHGGGSPDGALFGCRGVAEKMVEANIGWQLKPQGGLGHTAMGWIYSGRPVITNMSQNRSWGGAALRLFEPGVTCHDIEAHSEAENVRLIQRMLEPEENARWSERTRARFLEVINYEAEEAAFRKFYENLK
jgi:hypothetical protein